MGIGLGITFLMYLIQISVFWYVSKFPAKEINTLSGYRTKRSMKTQANWDYANALNNRLMLWAAHIFLVIAVLLLLIFHSSLSGQWYIGISTGLYLMSIATAIGITEYKTNSLKKHKVNFYFFHQNK